MSRKKSIGWDWIGDVPVFVYATFLDHFVFKVEVKLGHKEDAPYFSKDAGYDDKPWKTYIQKGLFSKDEVFIRAMRNTRHWLKELKS